MLCGQYSEFFCCPLIIKCILIDLTFQNDVVYFPRAFYHILMVHCNHSINIIPRIG